MTYNDKDKEIMFMNTEGFGRIIWNLEAEIVQLWAAGQIELAYERVKQLFMHVSSHLKDKNASNFFLPKFKEIEDLLYDPANKRFGKIAEVRKEQNRKKVDILMTASYLKLKEHLKPLEAFYGVPSNIIADHKREDNIKKIFGRQV